MKCFTWVAIGACLTINNLQKSGLQVSNRCYLRNEKKEDINHLFLTQAYFSASGLGIQYHGPRWCLPSSTLQLLRMAQKGYAQGLLPLHHASSYLVGKFAIKEKKTDFWRTKKTLYLNSINNCV